jgi:hypothetical protein
MKCKLLAAVLAVFAGSSPHAEAREPKFKVKFFAVTQEDTFGFTRTILHKNKTLILSSRWETAVHLTVLLPKEYESSSSRHRYKLSVAFSNDWGMESLYLSDVVSHGRVVNISASLRSPEQPSSRGQLGHVVIRIFDPGLYYGDGFERDEPVLICLPAEVQ